jgi:cell wall-associated NlpC family hydrolase
MQAAFAEEGIWLPRDAYQQDDFTQKVALEAVNPGDLVFFGTEIKIDHVGLYLGEDQYIHSSGKSKGRNGIAIDLLQDTGDTIGRSIYQRLRGFGRVVQSFPGFVA